MKIQYIGNFTDGTGWAKASTYNALALSNAGYDIYCTEIKYNNMSNMLEPEIQTLLEKQSDFFDVVIQHVLPRDYRYFGGVKNVGFTVLETNTLSNVPWIKNMRMMDEMLVPNRGSQKALESMGISSKILPHTFNFDSIANLEIAASVDQLKNTFNFVFVGEFVKRKNLEALIRAFHNEFDFIEPVNLYIKTWGTDIQNVNNFCQEIKNRLKKCSKYKTEVVICDYIPENIVLSTMKQCHFFVMPSYGEAWCYPAMESMALGVPVIYTKGIGIEDYAVDGVSGAGVESRLEFCYGATDTIPDLYTSQDTWNEISVVDLQQKMRMAFNTYFQAKDVYDQLSKNSIEVASKYNYKNCEFVKGIL
jgi:glycosyltransferase involved in cell wall biosynthesis